jgi:hypothetical protein
MRIIEQLAATAPRLVADASTAQEKDADRETSVVMGGSRRSRSENGSSTVAVAKRFIVQLS